MFLIFLIRKR